VCDVCKGVGGAGVQRGREEGQGRFQETRTPRGHQHPQLLHAAAAAAAAAVLFISCVEE